MQPLKIPIANIIVHYLTCNAFQRYWIDQMVFIIADINIRIEADNSSHIPKFCPCPKITHMVEEILMCLLVIVKTLCE